MLEEAAKRSHLLPRAALGDQRGGDADDDDDGDDAASPISVW